jgi:phosphinothricin acetyltransferase
MADNKIIRLAAGSDSAPILDIYAPFVQNTAVAFEYDVPTVEEMAQRIDKTLSRYPWVVCEVDEKVVGYAYASAYNERAAYQWSVTSSVYVDPGFQRQGIAGRLYTVLRDVLKLQGFHNVYAGITLPNQKSEGFHLAFGFAAVGTYHNAGYKLGRWHDVRWFELPINSCGSAIPSKTRTVMEALKGREAIVSG